MHVSSFFRREVHKTKRSPVDMRTTRHDKQRAHRSELLWTHKTPSTSGSQDLDVVNQAYNHAFNVVVHEGLENAQVSRSRTRARAPAASHLRLPHPGPDADVRMVDASQDRVGHSGQCVVSDDAARSVRRLPMPLSRRHSDWAGRLRPCEPLKSAGRSCSDRGRSETPCVGN